MSKFRSQSKTVSECLSYLSTGCGCRGPGRQAKGHHRFPDPHHAGAAGSWRESWAGHRGVPPRHPHPGGLCYPPQESQLWNLDWPPTALKKNIINKKHSHWPLSVCKGSPPWLLAVVIFSIFLLHGWKEQGRPILLPRCDLSPSSMASCASCSGVWLIGLGRYREG